MGGTESFARMERMSKRSFASQCTFFLQLGGGLLQSRENISGKSHHETIREGGTMCPHMCPSLVGVQEDHSLIPARDVAAMMFCVCSI